MSYTNKIPCLLLTLFLTAFIYDLNGQEVVGVYDNDTKEPIAFVKVVPSSSSPQLTDIDGRVVLDIEQSSSFHFSHYDYKDTVIVANELKSDYSVYMVPDAQAYDEVVIVPGENPAHRIIRNAINRRKENDPLRNNSFSYNSFSRFVMTGEPSKPFSRDTITDSAMLEEIDFFERQHVFLVESSSKRLFSPPNFDKEVVTAYKVSGFKDPLFATFVNQLQSFSFYDNLFSIMGKDYVNPIAPGGIRRYLYILEDTLFHEKDTTYIIKFQPRKGKNFDALKGYLHVHTNGWALERVIAEPVIQQEEFPLSILQEYKLINDQKWFPYNISTTVTFTGLSSTHHKVLGKSNLYIDSVEFDVPVEKRFNAIKMEVSKDAENDTIELSKARKTEWTDKEKETYHFVDSVSEKYNLERYLDAAKFLATGEIPIKFLSIPVKRLLGFNNIEGYRLGFGLKTNDRLARWFSTGGYFAYGFRDEAWKWGGNLDFNLYRKRELKLSFIYEDDVFERGGVNFHRDFFDLTAASSYRSIFFNRMDRQKKATIKLSGLVTPNFRLQLLTNYRRINLLDEYRYVALDQTVFSAEHPFDVFETGFIINWNIREKVLVFDDRRIPMGTKYPRLKLKAIKGWQNVYESDLEYYRFNFEIDQSFPILGVGRLNVKSINTLSLGNSPLVMQNILYGVAPESFLGVTIPNTFETMFPAEFFSSRQSALFLRMNFVSFKNDIDWTAPQISLHSAVGYGAMDDRFSHQNTAFRVPDKGFFESGILFNNLFVLNNNGYGLGVFYRYGHYAFPNWKDNLFFKLSFQSAF